MGISTKDMVQEWTRAANYGVEYRIRSSILTLRDADCGVYDLETGAKAILNQGFICECDDDSTARERDK